MNMNSQAEHIYDVLYRNYKPKLFDEKIIQCLCEIKHLCKHCKLNYSELDKEASLKYREQCNENLNKFLEIIGFTEAQIPPKQNTEEKN
jgi:hypothetical protein